MHSSRVSGDFMPQTIHAGSILLEDQPLIAQLIGFESERYLGNWGVVKTVDGFTLGRKVQASGWNFFFMAAEIKVVFFGALSALKIERAVKRILAKVQHQNYNGLEITGVVARHFLGVPYSVVSAHSRHIQRSNTLGTAHGRMMSKNGAG
jgi:hypothetical protein